MKNNKTLYWIAGITATLGGIYLVVSWYNRKQEEKKQGILSKEPVNVSPESEPKVEEDKRDGISKLLDATTQGVVNAVKNVTSRYMKYRVATKETALNVRQNPDGNSRIVSKLEKGSLIFGRGSKVVGWMEVSKDGKKSIGFVSSAFLKYEGL